MYKRQEIEIPEEERFLPCLKTASDEMKHNLLLKYYRKYLNDDGVIYTHSIASLKHTNFHFLVADGPTYFDTSNNPSFTFIRDVGRIVRTLKIKKNVEVTDNGKIII